jgi:hypothetical protein
MMTDNRNGWTVEKLLALGGGFWENRVFLTAVELNLFPFLAKHPATSPSVASHLGLDPRATLMLLDALTAMGLLTKEGETYRIEASAIPFLSDQTEETILPMAQHHANLWTKWSQLTEVVRTGKQAQVQMDEKAARANTHSFIWAMHVLGRKMADQIASVVDLSDRRHLLDVGGASGTYVLAFLARQPLMTATLFDRAEVIPMAQEALTKAGLLSRVTLQAGDFYVDDLPGGHDLALLSAIIHQNSREQNVALYKKIHSALIPGGRLLIRDHIMEPTRIEPPQGALFAINMLVNTEGGNTYTLAEIAEDLARAGFKDARLIQQGPRMDGLIQAVREG